MKKGRKADKFIPKPLYPGGPRKMSSFIYSHLKYHEDAIKDQIKGTVRIKIEIDYTGKVIGNQIMLGLTPSCNEEAERVANLLKFEFHHKLRKGKVRYYKTLNIKFSPPKKVKKPITSQINYTIKPSKQDISKNPKKGAPKTYKYQINIS